MSSAHSNASSKRSLRQPSCSSKQASWNNNNTNIKFELRSRSRWLRAGCRRANEMASVRTRPTSGSAETSLALSLPLSVLLIGLNGDAYHLLTYRPKVDVRDSSRRAIYSTSELTFCLEFVDSFFGSIVGSIAFVAMLLFHITGSLRFILSLIHLAHSRKSQ